MKVALTIAGSDSGGGAGIQLDLSVFRALGVHGVSAITALTAQNSQRVERVFYPPPSFVGAQIDALLADFPISAAKTGMLGRAATVATVLARVRRRRIPNLVVDPVIAAKDGTALVSGRGLELLKRQLLPMAAVVTPNVPEAERLSGIRIEDTESLRRAALEIARTGVGAVVIKGGHLPGAPVDTVYGDGEFHELVGERLAGSPVHGTGCLFSAALTARLALGDTVLEACVAAKAFTTDAIRNAIDVGKGNRLAVVGG